MTVGPAGLNPVPFTCGCLNFCFVPKFGSLSCSTAEQMSELLLGFREQEFRLFHLRSSSSHVGIEHPQFGDLSREVGNEGFMPCLKKGFLTSITHVLING